MSKLYRLGQLSENTEAFSKIKDRDLQVELLRVLTCAEYIGLANIMVNSEYNSKLDAVREKNNTMFNLAARVDSLELSRDDIFPNPPEPTIDKIIDTAFELKRRWDEETLK